MLKGVLIASAAILFASAPAASAPPIPGYIRQLQHQVADLQQQMANLPAQLAAARDRGDCLYAFTKDADRTQLHVIGLIVQQITGQPAPPDVAVWDDKGACQRSGIIRTP